MVESTVTVNRAPVLTLWAAIVAARMGYDWDAALSLGRAVAGLTAQTKGRRLGIFSPAEPGEGKPRRKAGLGEQFWVTVCGRRVPAKQTESGVRAMSGVEPVDAGKADAYLRSRFGDRFGAVRQVMEELAASFEPEELAEAAFALYERFRPQVSSGARGWGQKGVLDLDLIRSLKK